MANILTGLRILCAFLLLFFPINSISFYIFYFAGGICDVLDGIVARALDEVSEYGKKFDTLSDIFFVTAVLIKFIIGGNISSFLIFWILLIMVIKIINIIAGFIKYHHFIAIHSMVNKLCGISLFITIVFPVKALIVFTCILSLIAATNETYQLIKSESNI